MSAHSSGPWETYRHGMDVMSPDGHVASTETKADAALIVAAPDLLRVVEDALYEFDQTYDGEGVSLGFSLLVDRARAAAKKARGV